MSGRSPLYLAESKDQRIILPLDALTLVYQRRSGITHIVADPVPQILAAMGSDSCDAETIAKRLTADFDLGGAQDVQAVIAARLEELAALGLVEAVAT